MRAIERITFNPEVMGGKPCIRGLRVTVGTIVGLVATGHTKEKILELYPYLEEEDINQALSYAAWRSEEIDIPLAVVSGMKLLIDMNLSPMLATLLSITGWNEF
jgi:uncharacterized protein (DUF433 family)